MDIWDKKKRSEVMSKIRSTNTKPEVKLRKKLFAAGFRYRTNYKKLPGKPDIVLSKYKTVIFINGCFWHGHEGCKYFYIPKTNTKFWMDKIAANKKRDDQNTDALLCAGWSVVVIWECTVAYNKDIRPIIEQLQVFLYNTLQDGVRSRLLIIE